MKFQIPETDCTFQRYTVQKVLPQKYTVLYCTLLPLQDVQWGDIDYMERYLCFTYDKSKFGRLPQIVDDLHSKNMRFVPILDPCVGNQEPPGTYPAYDRGLQDDVFIKCRGKNGEGQVRVQSATKGLFCVLCNKI